MSTASPLPVAVRAYTERRDGDERTASSRRFRRDRPRSALVFDTETTTDYSQQLNFGSWRYYRVAWDDNLPILSCVEEGLFYADDLPKRYARGYQALVDYQRRHRPDVDRSVSDAAWRLQLVSAHEFVNEVLIPLGFRRRAWIVGFNLPFDISRVAYDDSESRHYLPGGFSLTLAQYITVDGEWREHRWRSRIAVKTIDSKRRLMGFKRRLETDTPDRVPDGEYEPAEKYAFRGHFLDLRTLAFALTNESYSLKRACEDFGVAIGKSEAKEHGRINRRYVDYNRRDVKASAQLCANLLGEYWRHPISLQPTKAYSPASVGKAYLRTMGIEPRLARQPDFPKEVLGHGMVAYYGGRAECRIRRTPVPVVYVDFLSMYPTVNSLMGLWDYVTADRVEACSGDAVTREVSRVVKDATFQGCFDRERWKKFVGLVKVKPQGDVLPVRSRYGHTNSWGIGINPLELGEHARHRGVDGLWYTIPDAIAAKILTGRTPQVLDAVRLVPRGGTAKGLKSTRLAGAVAIDPRRQDFFRSVIEERHRTRRRTDLPEAERDRIESFLKVLANSASYGIYAEMVREELPGRRTEAVDVYGAIPKFRDHDVHAPESPGDFAFPPMAACITGAAKLMLALLEREVTVERGGAFAFCDTDSMAIVATERVGLVPCEGGDQQLEDGRAAVKALSWSDVAEISDRFRSLSPYDSHAVRGSILELEAQNYTTKKRRRQRQLYCYVISAKRYALYAIHPDGRPLLREASKRLPGEKWSEHGLGHLLNPLDPEEDARDWIRRIWQLELERTLDFSASEPRWLSRPAVGRVTVGKPRTLDPFQPMNRAKPYAERIKPFNFLLTAHIPQLKGPPAGQDPERFQLIAPWEPNPREWEELDWANKYSSDGEAFRLTTKNDQAEPDRVAVQNYREVLAEYRVHPEPKSLAHNSKPAGWHSNGLLSRRPVTLSRLVHIGKESNELDEIHARTAHTLDETLNEHVGEDVWGEYVVPVLATMTRAQLRELGLSGTNIGAVKQGTFRGTARTRRRLTLAASDFARSAVRASGVVPPADAVDCCAAVLSAGLFDH